jgi:lysophospholipase L1-like esterase
MDQMRRALRRTGLFLAAGLVLSIPVQTVASGRALPDSSRAENGLFRMIRQSGDGSWTLLSLQPQIPNRIDSTPLQVDDDFRSLAVFSDAPGLPPWLAGEIVTANGGMIRVGRMENRTYAESVPVGVSSGWNGLADLCFVRPEHPWITWRRQAGSIEEIWVQDITEGRRWRVTPDGTAALSPPKILSDGRGGLWVLWAGREQKEYVLAARRFDGRFFSKVFRIAVNGDRPVLLPDAVLGRDGVLHAVWSAYDGRDYEIFTAENAGGTWTPPRPLTNYDASDGYPRLVNLGAAGMAVAWIRSGIEETRICASVLLPGRTASPVSLPGKVDSPDFVVFGTDSGPVFVPEDRGTTRTELLPLATLQAAIPEEEIPAFSPARIAPPSPSVIYNPGLDETMYIGFGDSITYGEWGENSDPTVGYPPRLDAALDAAFGPTTVINAGKPGEYTDGGLARIDSILSTYAGRWVLVMEGTNDVKAKTRYPIEIAIFNLREICVRCRNAGAYPLLATVIPRRDPACWNDPERRARHNALESGIRQTAADLKIHLVDMEAAFYAYPGGLLSLLQEDLKHPSLAGYQLLADTWETHIRALPFPPTNLRLHEKILTIIRNTPILRLHKSAEYDSFSTARLFGIVLFWQANPKIDTASIKGYRVYRKNRGEDAGKFTRLDFVSALCAFFDRNVTETGEYDYTVATLGTDDLEGPCSDVVSNY